MIKNINKKIISTVLMAIMTMFTMVNSFAYTTDQLVPRPDPSYITTTNWTQVTTEKLFFSNCPEQITQENPDESINGAVLYRDSNVNGTGKFRVFWSHINSTGGGMYIGVAIKNTSQSTVTVKYTKGAYDVNKTHQDGDGVARRVAGQQLLSKYLSSDSSEKTLATLSPGQKTYIGFYTNNGKSCLGMYDILIKNAAGNLVTNGITAFTYISGSSNPTAVIEDDYFLPRTGPEVRGLFPYATQEMSIYGSNKQLAFGTTQGYLCPLPPNDEPVGESEIDECEFDLHGSYGIISKITVYPDVSSAVILTPDWQQNLVTTHYLAASVTGRGEVTKSIPDEQGWVLKATQLSPLTITTSLPAYDTAPLHLSVMPEP